MLILTFNKISARLFTTVTNYLIVLFKIIRNQIHHKEAIWSPSFLLRLYWGCLDDEGWAIADNLHDKS